MHKDGPNYLAWFIVITLALIAANLISPYAKDAIQETIAPTQGTVSATARPIPAGAVRDDGLKQKLELERLRAQRLAPPAGLKPGDKWVNDKGETFIILDLQYKAGQNEPVHLDGTPLKGFKRTPELDKQFAPVQK